MPTGQQYATNVPQTTLTGAINASATSFSVASSASWPAVPFTAVLDIGTSTQEPVDVTAIVGTTWTVTRNIDGTTGFSHAIGATVTHADIGRDFREARAHIDTTGGTDSTGKAVHGTTSAVVGKDDAQTLTNKTLTSPTINGTVPGGASYTSPSLTGTVGGSATYTTPTLDRPVVGTSTPSTPGGTNVALFSSSGNLAAKFNTGTTRNITPPAVHAGYNGLLAATMDAASCSANVGMTSGVAYLFKITTYVLVTFNNIVLYVAGAGSTLTAGQNLAALYDSGGTRKAITGDQSAVWTSTGSKTMSVSGAVTIDAGDYYLAILSNGTTPATFSGVNLTAGPGVNIGITSAPFRANQTGGGQTGLGTSITLGSLTALGTCILGGLS